MTAERITDPSVPEPPEEMWSNCLRAGPFVFLSGITAGDPDGTVVGDTGAQAREILRRIAALLGAAGCSLDDLVRTTIYLTDVEDTSAWAVAREEFLGGAPRPCSTLVEVSRLVNPACRIEVEAIALRDDR